MSLLRHNLYCNKSETRSKTSYWVPNHPKSNLIIAVQMFDVIYTRIIKFWVSLCLYFRYFAQHCKVYFHNQLVITCKYWFTFSFWCQEWKRPQVLIRRRVIDMTFNTAKRTRFFTLLHHFFVDKPEKVKVRNSGIERHWIAPLQGLQMKWWFVNLFQGINDTTSQESISSGWMWIHCNDISWLIHPAYDKSFAYYIPEKCGECTS